MANATTGTVIKADADDARRYWLDEGRAPGGYISWDEIAKLKERAVIG